MCSDDVDLLKDSAQAVKGALRCLTLGVSGCVMPLETGLDKGHL